MSRIVLHLDMNSYFASVEQQANPHLRGRPVGVCEHLGGLIIAPSVEAKRLGIKLGTPVWEALKVCPQIVFLPTDPPKYREVTERFNRILADYSSDIQRYSIDESFVDITETCGGDWDDALMVGLAIKQRLHHEVGEWVSCSVGIGPNKLVAKVAADLDGGAIPVIPALSRNLYKQNDKHLLDRICVIRPEQVELLYDQLFLTDIPGIGKRLERALNKLGVFTLRQLRDYPFGNLINQFGIGGYTLYRLSNFDVIPALSRPPRRDESRPGNLYKRELDSGFHQNDKIGEALPDLPKSIGHAYTLPRATSSEREIKSLMMKLCEKVGRRMRKARARGRVVHYFDSSFHKQRRLSEPISDGRDIYHEAWGVFRSAPIHRPVLSGVERSMNGQAIGIKIMGITVSGLTFARAQQPLFPELKKRQDVASAMDLLNDKYGDWTVRPARLLGAPNEWAKDTVGFGRTKT